MSHEAKSWQFVCAIDHLSHAQCLEFELSAGSESVDESHNGFVLNWHGEIFAYLNSCPHTKVSMNWAPNQFFDIENQMLQCGLHGALFEPASGLCIHGPCLGQSLRRIPLKLENAQIFAEISQ